MKIDAVLSDVNAFVEKTEIMTAQASTGHNRATHPGWRGLSGMFLPCRELRAAVNPNYSSR